MKKALVIEDEKTIRENIVEFLESTDFSVESAEDGVKGIEAALRFLPDIIICDVMMPEADGYDVLLAVRKNPSTTSTPFIFLTARSDKPDIRLGMYLGADDYLTKPFSLEILLETIHSRLQKHELLVNSIHRQSSESIFAGIHEALDAIEFAGERLRKDFNSLSIAEIRASVAAILLAGSRIRADIPKENS